MGDVHYVAIGGVFAESDCSEFFTLCPALDHYYIIIMINESKNDERNESMKSTISSSLN